MRLIKKLFKKKKPYTCGGESCIKFWDDEGHESKIYYRLPNGDEILNFVHMTLESESSELRKLDAEPLTSYNIQSMIREKKFIPFGKKIIIKIEGYVDKHGKPTKDIGFVEKFFPHHIETVALNAYRANDKYKKKN